jgi:hypothetical protein
LKPITRFKKKNTEILRQKKKKEKKMGPTVASWFGGSHNNASNM